MKDRMLILLLGVSLGIILKFTIGPSSLFRHGQDAPPNATKAQHSNDERKSGIEGTAE